MAVDTLDESVTEALRAWRVQLDAGMALPGALQLCAGVAKPAAARAAFTEAARRATAGDPIDAVLNALECCITPAEHALVSAGWKGGRGESALNAVVEQRELWAATRRRIRSQMVLPIAVLLIACLVAPLPAFVLGGSTVLYVVSAFAPLVLALAAVMAVSHLFRKRQKQIVANGLDGAILPPSGFDDFLMNAPVWGGLERRRNLSECSVLLGQLVGAGVTLPSALESAARTLPNGLYRLECERLAKGTRGGSTLHALLQDGRLWPPEFLAIVNTGEQSGALEEMLLRFGRAMREDYVRGVERIGEWLPRILYGCVALFVIYNIFVMAGQLVSTYDSLMKP